MEGIFANRKSIYEEAKLKNTERWSRNIRKWDFERLEKKENMV